MTIRTAKYQIAVVAIVSAMLLTGCNRKPDEPEAIVTPTPEPSASPISILRETAEPIIEDPVPTEPFEITIPFAEGGTDVTEAAKEAIAQAMASKQYELGGEIVLRGHTDSVGTDTANLNASRRRAEAVANVFTEAGAEADRIEIIALGEMRPIAPNAKLDGTPDEDGRAQNRRVDVSVMPPQAIEEEALDTETAESERQEEPTTP